MTTIAPKIARDSTLSTNDRIAVYRLNGYLVSCKSIAQRHRVELIIGKSTYTGKGNTRGAALREAENIWRNEEPVLEDPVQTVATSVRGEVLPKRQS